jgi:hypothetical protein
MSRSLGIASLFATTLACAACQTQPLTTVSSVTTSATSVASGARTPRTEFGINEVIVVFLYATWPDVTAPAGTHDVDWRWYRDTQLISEHHAPIKFNTPPASPWTRRAAAGLGPGTYRVEARVDDQLMATNSFKIDATPVSLVRP